MTARVGSHASVELLSAYLDRQLVDDEARQLEEHLENCHECQGRLEGMQRVVANLRRLERLDPPVELEKAVARRIALAGESESFLDRVEGTLSVFNRQSTILPMFGVILALAAFIYMFSVAVDREGSIPVVFDPPVAVDPPATGESVAGRELHRDGEVWVERGVDRVAVSRSLILDSEAGRELLARHPELEELPRPVILRIEGEVLEIR